MHDPNLHIEDRIDEKMRIMQLAVQGVMREMDISGQDSEDVSGLMYSFWDLREVIREYRGRET